MNMILIVGMILLRAIQLRFGLASYDDPMELLTKLKHVNSVVAYKG